MEVDHHRQATDGTDSTRVGRACVALVASCVFALGLPHQAAADHIPGHSVTDVSAIDQYIERIPSSTGLKVPGARAEKPRPLPRQVGERLERDGGSDAPVLEEIATSPSLGAPQAPLRDSPDVDRVLKDVRRDDPAPHTAFTSAVSVTASGSNARLLALAIALAAISIALVVASARDRRRREPRRVVY